MFAGWPGDCATKCFVHKLVWNKIIQVFQIISLQIVLMKINKNI